MMRTTKVALERVMGFVAAVGLLFAAVLDAQAVPLAGQIRIDGAPAAGVQVAAATGNPDHAARTDEDGRFTFASPVPTGRLRLVLNIDEETVHHEEIAVDDLGGDPVALDLTRGRVRGIVIDADSGAPLRDAEISLTRLPGSAAHRVSSVHSRTADDGGFELRPTAPGRYNLIARRGGYALGERVLSIGEGATLDDVTLRLATLTDVMVQVQQPGGGVPRNLQATLFDDADRTIAVASGTGDDRLRLPSVPPGTWRLVVVAEGMALVQRPWKVPGALPAVQLTPEARIAIEVPALAASGTGGMIAVRDAEGQSVLSPWASQHSETWPIMGGTRTIGNLPAAALAVEVRAADGRTWQAELTTTAGETARLVLE